MCRQLATHSNNSLRQHSKSCNFLPRAYIRALISSLGRSNQYRLSESDVDSSRTLRGRNQAGTSVARVLYSDIASLESSAGFKHA